MNAFLEQFLIESRELVAQATDDLLALEARPGDAERLDSAFRAFHTLKGAAGIMDFAAMGLALHAAEDVLALARAGERAVTPGLIGDGLACLDQVLAWLAATEADGATPADAEAQAEALVRRFAREAPAPTPPTPPTADDASAAAPEAAARTLRVDVARIDALVALAGELTAATTALGHLAAEASRGGQAAALGEPLKTQHARLERLVGGLQRAVLALRVLPLRQVFQRFPRLVREMVAALGKPARLVTEGEATEADKAVVESLFEPLLHILRNALDHGVEPVRERVAAGKPESATIVLRGRREGEHVVVEVEDDGRGVDVDRVRDTALRRGVASAEALAAMSEAEITDLIFAPGFSTAERVTTLSGRGVGMDAVRTAVERLGGRVSVLSTPGVGTLVRLALPFTVMVSPVMTVECGGQMFGIPLEAVRETTRRPRADIRAIGAAQAVVVRDRTVPLLDLAEALGQGHGIARTGDASIVVVAAQGRLAGLEIDRFGERLDLMMKPLDGLLAGVPGVAGATLLGDGRVLLVLDVEALLQ